MARLRITRHPDPAHLDGTVVYDVEQRDPIFLFQTDVVIATQWSFVASFDSIEDAEACADRILEIEEARGYVAKEYN
jgi:hypothetical protein